MWNMFPSRVLLEEQGSGTAEWSARVPRKISKLGKGEKDNVFLNLGRRS